MKTYHKIQTLFLRDPETNFKTLQEGLYAKEEFEYLKDTDWSWTEKVDGTNIRVLWDGIFVEFRGKTNRAQLLGSLVTKLKQLFPHEEVRRVFPHQGIEEDDVCLYGEGYGPKIQSGGKYTEEVNFVLFDVKVNGLWLSRENVIDVGYELRVGVVPEIIVAPPDVAVELVKTKFDSTWYAGQHFPAEGLVGRPKVELQNCRGERVITKLKHRDFI